MRDNDDNFGSEERRSLLQVIQDIKSHVSHITLKRVQKAGARIGKVLATTTTPLWSELRR
jgi:hypothetical protein